MTRFVFDQFVDFALVDAKAIKVGPGRFGQTIVPCALDEPDDLIRRSVLKMLAPGLLALKDQFACSGFGQEP